jgi:RNA polymerase sigma-70 factor, ECF subfamily
MQTAEEIYREYFDQVYRFALTRTPSKEDAQDIVSRVFIKLVKNINEFIPKPGATVRSWLFTILRNEIIDFYRQQKPGVNLDSIVEEGYTPATNEYIDQQQDLRTIFSAIHKLPNRQQEIILLKYQSGLKNKEIAHILNLNEKTISATLSRTIQILRHHLAL